MARQDNRTSHWAVEAFERRYLGPSLTEEEREAPFWPYGTQRLYGSSGGARRSIDCRVSTIPLLVRGGAMNQQ